MVFDWTEKQNKKYIPLVTFVIGCAVGGVLMKWWTEKKGATKLAEGGAIAGATQPSQTIIVQPAAVAPVMPATPLAPPVNIGAGGGMGLPPM